MCVCVLVTVNRSAFITKTTNHHGPEHRPLGANWTEVSHVSSVMFMHSLPSGVWLHKGWLRKNICGSNFLLTAVELDWISVIIKCSSSSSFWWVTGMLLMLIKVKLSWVHMKTLRLCICLSHPFEYPNSWLQLYNHCSYAYSHIVYIYWSCVRFLYEGSPALLLWKIESIKIKNSPYRYNSTWIVSMFALLYWPRQFSFGLISMQWC